MSPERNIESLQKLLKQAKELPEANTTSPGFRTWRISVERTLTQIFGGDSIEVREFKKLGFSYRGIKFGGKDYSEFNRKNFLTDLAVILNSIDNYIDEFKEDNMRNKEIIQTTESNNLQLKKVFISHAHKDEFIVGQIIEILEALGLGDKQIFCTSFGEYGIQMGENFLERIKAELNSDSLVLFLLSENFYKSYVCLCEMGAAWVLTKEHIPILIPPFDFKDVEGVIPLTQGFKVNDSSRLNIFKDKVESFFGIPKPLNFHTWERKRDNVLDRINDKISKNNNSPSTAPQKALIEVRIMKFPKGKRIIKIRNTGKVTANNLTISFPQEDDFIITDDPSPIDIKPNHEIAVSIIVHSGSPNKTRLTFNWKDDLQENNIESQVIQL